MQGRLLPLPAMLALLATSKTWLTTPNQEYNATWNNLATGAFRHEDHRFEWTREEFRGWAMGVAERYGYSFKFLPVGPEDDELGPPTQMGVFTHGQRQPV
jgi:hypothetical protein